MKPLTYILGIFIVSLFLFSACDREKMDFGNNADGYGQLNLSSMKLTVDVKATPVSRAATVDASNYIVSLYSENGETLISEWKYSEMPEIFQLKVGSYKLIAHSPNTDGATLGEPYCEGSRTFTIQKDQVTNIETIKCTLSSIMVVIQYEDDLKALLQDDAKVTVTVGEESLEFTKDETLAGYFHAAKTGNVVDVKFAGTLEDDEEQTKITRSYTDIAIGSLLTVTYSLRDADGDPGTGGNADAALKIDAKCKVENIDGSVLPDKEPAIDDFPSEGGGEEPGENDPSVTGKDFDINKSHYVTDLQDVVVNLNAPAGMQNVIVTITSSNELFTGAVESEGMFGSNSFDLAHPIEGKQKEMLQSFGFPIGDQIVGQTNVQFIITPFMEALGLFEGTHSFHIEIRDNDGRIASATLKLIVIIEDEV